MPLFITDPATGRKLLSTRRRINSTLPVTDPSRRYPRTHCRTKTLWKSLPRKYDILVCPNCGKVFGIRDKKKE